MAQRLAFFLCGVGLLTLLACGGGGGGGGGDTRIPTLAGSTPADGATGVAVDTFVDLFWEQDLDPATVTPGHVELRAPSGPVSGALSYDAGARRIRFVSDENLVLGTRYTAHVSPGLAATDGQVLGAPYDVSFRVLTAAPLSTQLLETAAVDSATYQALALNDEGRGFAVWSQVPAAGNRTLRATRFDVATGRGAATALGSAASIGTTEQGVAVNQAGDAIVAWQTQDGTQDTWARIYRADIDAWSSTRKLNVTPGETARDARVGIDANGTAHVVWTQQAGFGLPEDLWYRKYARTGGWSAPARVETLAGKAQGVFVAVHPTGRACVAWHQQSPTVFNIYARRYHPATGWSAVESLEPDDTTRALGPQVVIAPSGDILVCWFQEEGAAHSDDRMWANVFVAGGGPGSGWQGEVLLRDDEGDHRGFQLVMDGSGNAIVGWQQYVNPYHHAYARRLPAGGSWEDVVTLSGTNSYVIDSWSLQLAMNPAGRTQALWAQTDAGGRKDLRARSYLPGSGWGIIAVVNPEGLGPTPTGRCAIDPEGNSMVVWQQGVYDTLGAYLRSDAWRNTYGPGLGWRGADPLEDDEVSSAYTRAVRMDRHGRGVVVWSQDRAGVSGSDLYTTIFR